MKKQNILEFWRNIEIFDLPQFNKKSYLLQNNETLPWLKANRPTKKDYTWHYTLIFGKIEKKGVVEYINNLLKANNSHDWEEPINGFTCLSALILDQKGCPQIDSYVVASYTKGIEALEKNLKLTSVSQALQKVQSDYPDRYNFRWVEMDGKQVQLG